MGTSCYVIALQMDREPPADTDLAEHGHYGADHQEDTTMYCLGHLALITAG